MACCKDLSMWSLGPVHLFLHSTFHNSHNSDDLGLHIAYQSGCNKHSFNSALLREVLTMNPVCVTLLHCSEASLWQMKRSSWQHTVSWSFCLLLLLPNTGISDRSAKWRLYVHKSICNLCEAKLCSQWQCYCNLLIFSRHKVYLIHHFHLHVSMLTIDNEYLTQNKAWGCWKYQLCRYLA